jgi:hypothetical protein
VRRARCHLDRRTAWMHAFARLWPGLTAEQTEGRLARWIRSMLDALPCAWALGRLVEAQLFGIRAVDGPTIAVASGLLALVALGAAMLPAWRAASVSPTEALRCE